MLCGVWGVWFVVLFWCFLFVVCGVVWCLVCGVWCLVLGGVFWNIFCRKCSREEPKWSKMEPWRGQNGPKWSPGGAKMDQNGAREVPWGDIGGPNGTEDGKEGPGYERLTIFDGFWFHFGGHFGVIFCTFWHLFWGSILASILVSFLMVFGAIFGYFLETELV